MSSDGSLIDLFLEYTRHTPSPEVYRRWAAIHAIGAVGERKLWSSINGLRLFPNLFLFLVGPPGTGKSAAINPVSEVLRKAQVVNLAPTDVSKQGLLDMLMGAGKGAIIDGTPIDYHFMAICISELSNFMSQYDGALAGLLTDIFDCPPILEEKKRGITGGSKVIPFPGLSFVMGTATQNLGNTISDELWGSGFMARVVLIYSDELIRPPSAEAMFATPKKSEALAAELDAGLRRIGEMKGEMTWEPEAKVAIWQFWTTGDKSAPIHNRLANYVTRRWMHLAKLCMIVAMADERMTVRKEDFDQAYAWLLAVESDMPEIFKDMVSHEDGQVYEELRTMIWGRYMQSNRDPIPHSVLIAFLAQRVSNHSVQRMLEVAEAADYIRRVAGTSGDSALYTPGANTGKNLGVI